MQEYTNERQTTTQVEESTRAKSIHQKKMQLQLTKNTSEGNYKDKVKEYVRKQKKICI